MSLLLIAALAGGAYLLGRRKEPRKSPAVPSLPPLPPAPPPVAPPGGTSGPPTALGEAAWMPDYGQLWAMTRFGVETYPADADPRAIAPPTTPDGLSTDPGCRIVAVGDMWWDRVGELGQSLHDQGVRGNELRANLLQYLAPECLEASGAGAAALVEELNERLGSLLPTLAQVSRNPFDPIQIWTSPAYKKSSIGLVRLNRRRRRGRRRTIVWR